MKLTVDELADLTNRTNEAVSKAYEKGVKAERERELPNNLFEAVLEYGRKTKTLVDYHKSSSEIDGCNWVQIKPTRTGAKGVKSIEISFEENLMEIDYIGVNKD